MRVRITEAEAKRCGIAVPKGGAKSKAPKKGDAAADAVIAWCKQNGFPVPKRELMFAEGRRWRFDLAWTLLDIANPLAVEVNGGGWVNGRHNRGSSLEAEYEKLAHAAALGWRVIPVTYAQLNRGDLWPLLKMALT